MIMVHMLIALVEVTLVVLFVGVIQFRMQFPMDKEGLAYYIESGKGALYAYNPSIERTMDVTVIEGGNAVFGIHPAGCAHADVAEDAARPVEVVVEVAAGVGMGILGIKMGR